MDGRFVIWTPNISSGALILLLLPTARVPSVVHTVDIICRTRAIVQLMHRTFLRFKSITYKAALGTGLPSDEMLRRERLSALVASIILQISEGPESYLSRWVLWLLSYSGDNACNIISPCYWSMGPSGDYMRCSSADTCPSRTEPVRNLTRGNLSVIYFVVLRTQGLSRTAIEYLTQGHSNLLSTPWSLLGALSFTSTNNWESWASSGN